MDSKKPRFRKSVWIPLLLLVYSTGCFIYFFPRNFEIGTTEKWVTITANFMIIGLLAWLLRKKEKMAKEREDDLKK